MTPFFVPVILLISSLLGGVIFFQKQLTQQLRNIFLAIGAGAMVSVSLVHILPESSEISEASAFAFLAGFLLLYVLEEFATPSHTHDHCNKHSHDESHESHTNHITIVSFIAITLHTVFDGVLLASVALNAPETIPLALIAIVCHQIPVSFALASLLSSSAYKVREKMTFFTIFAVSPVIGYIMTLLGAEILHASEITLALLSAGAGGSLLYVATADLLPLIHRSASKRLLITTVFLCSSIIIASVKLFE